MMLMMMMFACLLTYVIPAGEFDTTKVVKLYKELIMLFHKIQLIHFMQLP